MFIAGFLFIHTEGLQLSLVHANLAEPTLHQSFCTITVTLSIYTGQSGVTGAFVLVKCTHLGVNVVIGYAFWTLGVVEYTFSRFSTEEGFVGFTLIEPGVVKVE
jgi:hypothetical protein